MGDHGTNRRRDDDQALPDCSQASISTSTMGLVGDLSEENLDARMQLIVESAETKLLRQRQQQQQLQLQHQSQQSLGLKRLKSPAFLRNTLDEDCLQKLATTTSSQQAAQGAAVVADGPTTTATSNDLATNRASSHLVVHVDEHRAPLALDVANLEVGVTTPTRSVHQKSAQTNRALIPKVGEHDDEDDDDDKNDQLNDIEESFSSSCTLVTNLGGSSTLGEASSSSLAKLDEFTMNEANNKRQQQQQQNSMIRMLDERQQQRRRRRQSIAGDISHSLVAAGPSSSSEMTPTTEAVAVAEHLSSDDNDPSQMLASAADKLQSRRDAAHRDAAAAAAAANSSSRDSLPFVVSSPESLLGQQRFRQQQQPAVRSTQQDSYQQPEQQQQQQRRHSTYMLPIVLNHRRLLQDDNFGQTDKLGGGDDDDDDDYDDNGDDDYYDGDDDDGRDGDESAPQDSISLESSGQLASTADDLSSGTGDDDKSDDDDDDGEGTRAETARLLTTPKAPQQRQYLIERPTAAAASKLAAGVAILPNSASSPSALSTPTNLDRHCCCDADCCANESSSREKWLSALGCSGGGRGPTACCAATSGHQGELIKLANDNAALSRQLFYGCGVRRPSTGQVAIGEQPATGTTTMTTTTLIDWRQRVSSLRHAHKAAASRGNSGEQQARKTRSGSNPLDRLRIFNPPEQQSSSPSKKQQPPPPPPLKTNIAPPRLRQQLQPDSGNNRKRHSIISIFSSSSSSHHQAASGQQQQQRRRLSSLVGVGAGVRSSEGSRRGELGARGPRNSLEGALQFDGRRSSGSKYFNLNKQQPPGPQYQHQQSYDPLIPESGFKIVVMGTSGSGKTAIIQRFLYDSFNKRHVPTVEDTYFIEFPHMKNLINISISDTSGTYQFPAMRKLAINSGDAFILVYSVDDPKSFDDLEQLRQNILEQREQAYLETSASIMSIADSSSSSGLGSSSLYNSAASIGSGKQQANNYPTTQPNLHNAHHRGPSGGATIGNMVSAGDASSATSQLPHRSLASLFQSNHTNSNNHQQQPHHWYNQAAIITTNANHLQQQQQHGSSLCSSSSACSSADNSRRSSVSAAEAALRTRRTRRPPMVIVANKHDLPEERHLVNSDEIEALTVIDWNNGFVRASAALNLNISEIFQEVLRQARQPPTLTEAIVGKRRKSLPPKLH